MKRPLGRGRFGLKVSLGREGLRLSAISQMADLSGLPYGYQALDSCEPRQQVQEPLVDVQEVVLVLALLVEGCGGFDETILHNPQGYEPCTSAVTPRFQGCVVPGRCGA